RFGNRHFIASHSLHGDLRVVAGLSTNGPVCTATQSVLQSSLDCKPKSATGKLLCAPNQVRPSRQRARGSLSPFRFRLSIANALSRTPRCGRLSPRNRQALLGISSPGFYSQRISGRRPPMKLCRSQISLLAIFLTGWLASDRKSTRLNSSHGSISYAVFCLKKKKKKIEKHNIYFKHVCTRQPYQEHR